MKLFEGILFAIERAVLGRERSDLLWWRRRAARRGARAVVSLAHTRAEIPTVTEYQKSVLFPLLSERLRGDEQAVLDFGCGTGRFTADLATLVGGRAVGVDPIEHLIALAPQHPSVEYHVVRDGTVPVADASFDVVWVCVVLMGITDQRALARAAHELRRVLRPGGLLFVAENTTEQPHAPHLYYRSVEEYQALLSFANLEQIGEYLDLGERISVLAGRSHE